MAAGVFGVAGSFLAFLADFGCASESAVSLRATGDSSAAAAAPRLRFDAVLVTDGVVGSAFACLPRPRPLVAGVFCVSAFPVIFARSY